LSYSFSPSGHVPTEIEDIVSRASQAELERFLERTLSADSFAAVFASDE
jgi:hypothetical protein